MKLTTKQRIDILKNLADKIDNMDQPDARLVLKEYTKEVGAKYDDSFYNFNFSYDEILPFIQDLDNKIIFKMYEDLFPEEAKKEFSETKPVYRLLTDKLVLFFSHSHKDKKLVTSVKSILEKTDWIECFMAHKDIKLSKEWEQEIKKYLFGCHCFVAFISEHFKSSPYCDQELGMAIQRDIPICSFTLDKTGVYGFIKHLQSKPFKNPEDSANQIERYIFDEKENLYQIAKPKLQKAIEVLKNNFLNSSNKDMAKSVLDQLIAFKPGDIEDHFIKEIQKNWHKNNKIREVKNIEQNMEEFFKKHSSNNIKNAHQKTANNAQSFEQKTILENKELPNTKTDLRKILEQPEEKVLPF